MSANSTLAPADTAAARPAVRRIQRWLMRNGTLLLMALPGMGILFTFSYLPMPGIILAFKDFNAAQGIWGSEWVGFRNFQFLFSTETAWRIIRNTLLLNALFIVTTLVAAVTMAILLNEIIDTFPSTMIARCRHCSPLPIMGGGWRTPGCVLLVLAAQRRLPTLRARGEGQGVGFGTRSQPLGNAE
jgi:hypothetical protein